MHKNRLKIFLIAFLVTVLMHVVPSDVRAQAGPATFTEIQPLVYGLILPGPAGGTLTLSDTGVVSVTGTVTYLGGASNARVLMNSCLGSRDLDVRRLSCTSPGQTSANNRCRNFNGTAGNDILIIGGRIRVPAGQTPGFYTGTFDIVGENNPACP